ncbi:E3 ubiquitin-protein ligase Siah2-like [Macrosteles quadrilineatus]|uniref:E3 ubiquitin-protein ligase Siah2-like n=1 Tax=Macrosteles quadrilineatus TaxID=74068 RepID=UPI0023E27E95|nr:E3 ubiquitin-protein ligase Siah2-like [Macrosteles quadrilineatus]
MANKLQPEELQDVILALCEIFKCSICLEALQKDTTSCINGHCICTNCRGKQETCRRTFSNVVQNCLVSQVLDVIPHTCRYKNCWYLVTAKDDHESYCAYKPTQFKNCEWQGPAVELTDHFKQEHPEKMVFLEKTQPIRTFCENFKTDFTFTSQFSIYGHFLWLVKDLNVATGVLKFTFIPVFCDKPKHDINVKVSFQADEKEYKVSTRVRMDVSVDVEKDNCLLVPVSMLHHFYSKENKDITYSVFITKA